MTSQTSTREESFTVSNNGKTKTYTTQTKKVQVSIRLGQSTQELLPEASPDRHLLTMTSQKAKSENSKVTFKEAAETVQQVGRQTRRFTQLANERETLHRKTFTKWVNAKLSQRKPPLAIKDVVVDLADGRMLLYLLEVLLNTTLKQEKGRMRVHKLNNVEQALGLLQKNKVKLVGINGFDIVDGKPRAVLGLMWSVILRFQVQEVMQETTTEEASKNFNAEKKLLDWCNERLKGYEGYVQITDFSTSWRDGLAFNALIHSYRPDLFDFEALSKQRTPARLEHAFKMADKEFEVPCYLDSSDIDVPTPDKKLIMMYLTEMYNNLEGSKAKQRQASIIPEGPIDIKGDEKEDGGLDDSWDQMDSKRQRSASERDRAVEDLTIKLNNADSGLTYIEGRKPIFNESNLLYLPTVAKLFEEHKEFEKDLEPIKLRTYEVLNEGRSMMGDGYFDKGEEEHFEDRMDTIDKRMQDLVEHSPRDHERLNNARCVLLKQQAAKMSKWLNKAEKKMVKEKDIGPDYETTKKQMDEHQKFKEEVGDMSLVTALLATDTSDPELDDKTRQSIKDISSRWEGAWDWSEDRNRKLTKAMIDWEKFRREELILLNWLSQKEKTLKDVAETDVADDEQVDSALEQLEGTQKELDEQDRRLQYLRELGKELMEESGNDEETTKEINTQLKDFDDCWNHVAKKTIAEKEEIINAKNKMKEMYELMDSVNPWVDEAQRLLDEYNDDMTDEEKDNLKKRAEIKLEEKASMQVKVDRVNRLGGDVCDILDGPSQKKVKGELQDFNDRWQNVSASLESYNDKGYPEGNECCLMRVIKRRFKATS